MAVLEVQHLKKIYTTRFGGNRVQALSDVGFTVEQGEYVAIMGESGSGKTTLLNILAALDRPTSGSVLLDGTDLSTVKESGLAAFRRDNLGFVFQDFNLLDTFSVRDNILLPLVLSKVPYLEMECRLAPLADKLGLTELLDKFPYEISGGQKQRTAAARALITNPHILLADEPTGNVTLVQFHPKERPVILQSLSTRISFITDRHKVRCSSRVKASYMVLKSCCSRRSTAAKSGGGSAAGSGICRRAAE